MSDASLRAQIDSDKAKREKYKRVRSSIQSHGLNSDGKGQEVYGPYYEEAVINVM